MEKTKICSKCGEEKPATTDYFYKNKDGKFGVARRCKECVKADARQYHEKHKESNNARHREYSKQYYLDNKEKELKRNKAHREAYKDHYKETSKVYYELNKERILETTKTYQREHREERSAHAKIYNEANKERIKEQKQQYYLENKERILARCKEYTLRDPEKTKLRNREWAKNNKDKHNMRKQRRRSRQLKLPTTLTEQQWQFTKDWFGNKCCYCGSERKLEQEHFIPVTSSGGYTHDNIVCACKSCNNSKGTKPFDEWYPTHKDYSPERERRIFEFLNHVANCDDNTTQQLSIL